MATGEELSENRIAIAYFVVFVSDFLYIFGSSNIAIASLQIVTLYVSYCSNKLFKNSDTSNKTMKFTTNYDNIHQTF